MREVGENFSASGPENHGFSSLNSVFWNLNQQEIYKIILERGEGKLSKDGAMVVETGVHTGRSAQDKFVVKESANEDAIWWNNAKEMSEDNFDTLYKDMIDFSNDKDLFIQDLYGGADLQYRLPTRIYTEYAWHSLFIQNLLITVKDEEKTDFDPEFVIIDLPSFKADPNRHGSRSETVIAVNFAKKIVLIAGTSYAGEIKKSVFTMLNFLLPPKNVMPMHCSVNVGNENDSAIFFGLSGTGKTTLSTDPKRQLIGDDEHGWDNEGVFNFEGGCYAKTIDLDKDKEPDIFKAVRRNALLENVTVNENGIVDYSDTSVTQNTRVSYPIHHIDNIVKPISKGEHASKIIFLTADAFGVLPPISKLSYEQAEYHFLSGFTAKLAGTERGVTEPQPAFSACYGAAFLMLHPTRYSNVLSKKMKQSNSQVFLVNTGWNGKGDRISLKDTRLIIDAILNDELKDIETEIIPYFNLSIPKNLKNISSNVIDPRKSWDSDTEWEIKAKELAQLFINNFQKFCDDDHGKRLLASGPQL